MLALLVCTNRDCRAAFEVEGTREAIAGLRCEDCEGALNAVAFADAEPASAAPRRTEIRRAA